MNLVAVVGPGRFAAKEAAAARRVESLSAGNQHGVVSGELGGVIEAVCRGARQAGGQTVGVLPGANGSPANPQTEPAGPTGPGKARNTLVVRFSRAVMAIRWECGMLSGMAFALKFDGPVVGIGSWKVVRKGRVDRRFESAGRRHSGSSSPR